MLKNKILFFKIIKLIYKTGFIVEEKFVPKYYFKEEEKAIIKAKEINGTVREII